MTREDKKKIEEKIGKIMPSLDEVKNSPYLDGKRDGLLAAGAIIIEILFGDDEDE